MNELRLTKIVDVDVSRMQVHIKNGKGRKQRYVGLSVFLAKRLPLHLNEVKPTVYLFEGLTPDQPMGERSIQYIISEALQKTTINKAVSMHTLRHSYATHLLADGVNIQTIQHLPWAMPSTLLSKGFFMGPAVVFNEAVVASHSCTAIILLNKTSIDLC